jgi:hypothetical protein
LTEKLLRLSKGENPIFDTPETLWEAAEDRERHVIIQNMVESVTVFPDHMEVKIVGSPALHVLYTEVGLKGSENVQVGGPT